MKSGRYGWAMILRSSTRISRVQSIGTIVHSTMGERVIRTAGDDMLRETNNRRGGLYEIKDFIRETGAANPYSVANPLFSFPRALRIESLRFH